MSGEIIVGVVNTAITLPVAFAAGVIVQRLRRLEEDIRRIEHSVRPGRGTEK